MRRSYWRDPTNVKNYLDSLASKLGYNKMEDWYQLDGDLINNHSLLKTFHSSPSSILSFAYPHHPWTLYKFKIIPRSFSWSNMDNQLDYMLYLGRMLNYTTMKDWYQISFLQLSTFKGRALLALYGNSPRALVMSVFGNHPWEKFLFNIPAHFYNDERNQREYMEWLGACKLGYTKMEDWYKIDARAFEENNGVQLLSLFERSPPKAVIRIFPEHKWQVYKFKDTPNWYWREPTNQREFLEFVGSELGYTKMEDYYKISARAIKNCGGETLTSYFGGSPSNCVMELFKEHHWNHFMFSSIPNGYWLDPNHRRSYMEWLGCKLGYVKMEDWYQIDQQHLVTNFGNGILTFYGSPSAAVVDVFKEKEWNLSQFAHKNPWQSQATLAYILSILFPGILRYTLLLLFLINFIKRRKDRGEFQTPSVANP